MTQGRKPLPTNLKLLKGTAQPCRMNKNEPKPKSDKVKMPTFLSPAAKKCWRRVSKTLSEAGLLTNLDVDALATYCEAFARWVDANEKVEKMGGVIKSPNGYPIINPYLSISNKAQEQMKTMITEFGMTPSSRTKIDVKVEEEIEDPVEAYRKRKNTP